MKENIYNLTTPQNSILLTEQYYAGSNINNIGGSIFFEEKLDFDLLEKAINLVTKHNPSFQIKLVLDGAEIKQYFSDYIPYSIELIDVLSQDDVSKLEYDVMHKPFDIFKSLFLFKLFRFPNGSGGYIINLHHIISDSWSIGLTITEIARVYTCLVKNEEPDFSYISSYADYILDEKNYRNSDKFNKDKEYWNSVFETVPSVASFPSRKQENQFSCKANRINYTIGKDEMDKINDFCKKINVSVYNFFMAIFAIYTSGVTGLDDFVIGTPILGRTNFKEKNTTGMFINVVPLRFDTTKNLTFNEFASTISKNSLGMLRHQKYSNQYIIEDLRRSDPSLPSLYNMVLSYQITKAVDRDYIACNSRWGFNGNTVDDVEIHIYDLNDTGSVNISYDYRVDKYDEEDINNVHMRILHMISQVVCNEQIGIHDIEIVTSKEKHDILYDFNNTDAEYPKDKTVIQLFEEQVSKNPDGVAVIFEDQKLTYKELNEKANKLAHYLIDNEVKNNDVISVCMNKNISFIITILGVLKCGCAYLPINPTYPINRINFIVQDSKSSIFITDTNYELEFTKTLNINTLNYLDCDYNNLSTNIAPSDLAYIIYTSGSTGNPKGVMVTHNNLVNFLFSFNNCFNNKFGSKDNCLSLTNISFDVSVCEIFTPLTFGCTLTLYPEDTLTSVPLLCDMLSKYKVTFLYIPPSVLNDVSKFIISKKIKVFINKLLVGVEKIKNSTLNTFLEINKDMEIINGYGPTEATICTTFYKYQFSDNLNENVPIGYPISNSKIFILNKNENLLPIGVIGELCISGDNVSKGYLNNIELTKKSFINNSEFSPTTIYKTGDLAFWTETGTLSFIGRNDSQIKFKGHRIELNEINTALTNINAITNSYTMIRKVNNIDSICSYVTTNETINIDNIYEDLYNNLPYYMIPSHIIALDSFPLTLNGKIDKSKLPEIIISASVNNNETNYNETQLLLINTICKLLNIEHINIQDNLFDLGLDSLTAIKLVTEIFDIFNVNILIKDIFENATIKKLSKLISSLSNANKIIIPKVEEKEYYPVSSAQRRMYYASSLDTDSLLYNIAGGIILDKEPNVSKLENCFNTIINRHESLHTYFDVIDGDIVQKILDNFDFKLEVENSNSNDIDKLFNDFVKPFNLNKAPLFDAKLINLSDNKSFLLLNMHHIISDGTSLSILMDELCKLYNNSNDLPELDISYKDFAVWENNKLNSDEFNNDKEFWVELFSDEIPLLNMPTSYARPTVQSFEGDNVFASIDNNLTLKLNQLSKELVITPYMLLLSAYYILLYKYTGQEDIIVGSPIVGRDNTQVSNIIGMFVNSLVLKNKLDASLSFKDFASIIKDNCLKAFEHQTYPFDELVKALDIKRDTSRNPLFDTMFIYQNNGNASANFDGINAEIYVPKGNIAKFDLSLEVIPENDVLNLRFEYCTKLFNKDFITRLSKHYLNILQAVINDNDIQIASIDMLGEEEKNQILYDFNNTKADYPKDKTIVDLFEEQVKLTPNNIALVFENQSLTYKELNEKANSLAFYLRNKQVKNNSIVGIMLNRSLEMIIGILAVLKSGGAYIPIDPDYPTDRIEYLLDNSNCSILLTSKDLFKKINIDCEKIDICLNNNTIYNLHKDNLTNISMPNDLSYIIYTSGSTGKPKGVMLTHKALTNLTYYCNNIIPYLKNRENIAIVSVTTISFDIFIFETLISLQRGLKLVIANSNEQTIPHSLNALIQKENIQAIQTTPSRMQLFYQHIDDIPNLSNLKYIILAGEPLPINLKNNLLELTHGKVFNGYGPSETTVFSTLTDVTKQNEITIGKPLANTQIYILDNNLKPCPIGVSGEIYISGDGVGRGYMNNPVLTNENFVYNPFIPNTIMYKTGDIGLYKENGEIICLGRVDHQVKLRGLRIELSEIENVLIEHFSISNCIVVKKISNDNHEFLCAYYTSDEIINENNLRSVLKSKLPNYMVPQFFVKLDKLPYTPNGKIDKKALPDIDFDKIKSNKEITKPRNEIDNILISSLVDLLKIKNISINDSFYDLGGDSLVAIQLCSIIYHKLNVQISIKDIFSYPIIMDLSDYINSKSNKPIDLIPVTNKMDYYPVSSAQRRMYYASSLDTDSLLYNIAGGIILDKEPNVSKLENCFNTIINRHESLHTYFDVIDGDIVQKILDNFDFKLEVENSNSNDIDKLFNDFVKPFNLNKAPLFDAKLINLSDNKSFLLLNMHHIISDGTSLSILMDELCKLYNNSNDLPELDISYKDFAVWENNKLNSDEFNNDKEFWVELFSDEIPLLNMPTSYARPTVQSFEGDNVFASIDNNLTLKLNQLSKELVITPYMLLLSAYYILLYKYTGQEDIIVGSPIVGRDNTQVSNIIGMFVNSLVLKNKLDASLSFKDFASIIKDNCLKAFEHQTYPFDELVKALDIKRDTSRNPLFDTMFIYQNNGNASANFDGINAEIYVPKGNIAKFDLSLEVIPENDVLNLRFEYCTKLFNKDFITRLSKHYLNILQAVINDNDIQIASIDMLGEEEKNQILYDFNNTKADYPKDKTIVDLFEEQVIKNPDGVAVIFEDQKLTYKELNEKANKLAHYLVNNGVKNNDVISVCMNKNISFIITILGVLKCGCAYLPINPTYPINRINYIVQDSKSSIFITDTNYELEFTKTLNINTLNYLDCDYNNLSTNIAPSDLAYIIYTSGSTGNPKGVMVTHNNLVNFLFSFNNCFNNKFGSKDNCLSLTNISFDVSVCEIFTPLTFGCTLTLYPEDTLTSVPLLCDMLSKYKVTFLYIPPSVLNDVSKFIISKKIKVFINKLLVGVEKIKNSTLNTFLEINKDMEIINGYGPTEATICTTFYKYQFSDNLNENVPIGYPISNSKIFILNKNENLLPIGVIGELCISGDNVSKGYLNNIELTKKSFINNSKFSPTTIYKTGDLAFWTENGTLSFIGRNDSQIKFKGHRIELNEINSTLRNITNITNAYTMIRKVNNIDCICSFITANANVDLKYVNNYLKKNLPYYMIPSHVVVLDAFPLTLNGKIDVKNLREYKITTSKKSSYVAPENELQKLFCDTWEKLLNTKVGINDDIFELGADSLLAIKFKVEMLSNNVNIEYADIFKYPTVKELSCANTITISEQAESYNYTEIDKILEKNNIKNCRNILTNKNNNVLLLGSNGFVGMHILYNFIKYDSGKIYCIVRDKNKLSARTRFLDALHFYFDNELDEFIDNRIIIFKGDITKEKFGLKTELYNDIVENVSIVINSSANVRHYGNFKNFEDINIGLTKKAIEFCEIYNKRLIQISSVSVSGENINNEIIGFSENNLYIGQNLDNVYVRSKFEAEKIILEHITSGLNAQILRLGNITNRYSDGKFQINPKENAFIGRIQSLIKLGVVPDYLLSAKLEFTPVDLCGFAIISIMQNYVPDFSVFHLYNDTYITMKDFIDILKKYDINLKVVNYTEFNKIIKNALLNDNKTDILSGIINELNLDNNFEINSNIDFLSEFSRMFLNRLDFNWSKIDNKYLEKYIKYFKYIKFF